MLIEINGINCSNKLKLKNNNIKNLLIHSINSWINYIHKTELLSQKYLKLTKIKIRINKK